jgi:hypothetical protein
VACGGHSTRTHVRHGCDASASAMRRLCGSARPARCSCAALRARAEAAMARPPLTPTRAALPGACCPPPPTHTHARARARHPGQRGEQQRRQQRQLQLELRPRGRHAGAWARACVRDWRLLLLRRCSAPLRSWRPARDTQTRALPPRVRVRVCVCVCVCACAASKHMRRTTQHTSHTLHGVAGRGHPQPPLQADAQLPGRAHDGRGHTHDGHG